MGRASVSGAGVGVGAGVGDATGVGVTVATLVAVAAGVVVGLTHASSKTVADRAISAYGRFMLKNLVNVTSRPIVRDRRSPIRVPQTRSPDLRRSIDLQPW